MKGIVAVVVLIVLFLPVSVSAQKNDCVDCHQKITPNIVKDWQLSVHSGEGVECLDCHGNLHKDETDVDKVLTVTAATCAECHDTQFEQFSKGKHRRLR